MDGITFIVFIIYIGSLALYINHGLKKENDPDEHL